MYFLSLQAYEPALPRRPPLYYPLWLAAAFHGLKHIKALPNNFCLATALPQCYQSQGSYCQGSPVYFRYSQHSSAIITHKNWWMSRFGIHCTILWNLLYKIHSNSPNISVFFLTSCAWSGKGWGEAELIVCAVAAERDLIWPSNGSRCPWFYRAHDGYGLFLPTILSCWKEMYRCLQEKRKYKCRSVSVVHSIFAKSL